MNNKIVIGVVVLVVLGAGIMLLSNKAGTKPGPQQTSTQNTQTTTGSGQQATETANVTLTSSGFEPQTITAKKGTKIVWTNKSGSGATVNSDLHPTHLLYPPLNLGGFDDGQTLEFVAKDPGKYTYHDHLNPSRTGTIVVE